MYVMVSGDWRIIVTTESGARYFFESKSGKVSYRMGFVEGIVVSFANEKIEVGKPLIFYSCDFDLYDCIDEDETRTETSKVIRVEILG